MPLGVSEARAILLPDGGVLISGGDRATGGVSDLQRYDSKSGAFTRIGQMFESRFVHILVHDARDRVIALGGFNRTSRFLQSAEQIDPANGTATPIAPLCAPRDNQHAVPLADGRLLLIGGDSDEAGYIRRLDIYDPAGTDTRCDLSLVTGRVHEEVFKLGNGQVLVFGGLTTYGNDVVFLSSVERIDELTLQIRPAGSLPHARKKFQATLLNDG